MPEWFRRTSTKISSEGRRELPAGAWIKCPKCSTIMNRSELDRNLNVCTRCPHHFRISSNEYVNLLLDEGKFEEIGANIQSVDALNFKGNKAYKDQLKAAKEKTNLSDAIRTMHGKSNGYPMVLGVMDFSFIGGSMGSVVGERISRAVDFAREKKWPLVIISASGGARMQEAAYSLMQMAKTSAKLALFSQEGGLYISVLTDPTTGGTSASYAMLGDIIIAEPNALIGFAGARVIKQTIGQDLPEGFQTAEFLLEKGFVDRIVPRGNLKASITQLFDLLTRHPGSGLIH